VEVNIGYAWSQLARAIASGHAEKIAKWQAVVDGMKAGTIAVGSRRPTHAPTWATLEVVTGGFATGGFVAGGPLHPDETALAASLGIPPSLHALNLHFSTSTETLDRLEAGTYRIDVPEQGALLAIAWLRARGHVERASTLMETIGPWFDTMRFFPRLAETALDERDTVRLQDASKTLASIATPRRQERVETQHAAVTVWRPLFDRAIVLAREAIAGGMSPERLAELRADLAAAGAPTTSRARTTSTLIARLARFERLTTVELGDVRRLVHQRASSPARVDDSASVRAPLHADLRSILVDRLFDLEPDGGIDLDAAMRPVTSDEASGRAIAGTAMPAYFEPKLARSWDASLEQLVDRGVIRSGETVAIVLPQITSRVRAGTFDDPSVRRLYASLYTAFRRRRSLLLLNFAAQVRFRDLPWVSALDLTRKTTPTPAVIATARETVAATAGLVIRAFPQTITPNKLVTELHALVGEANLEVPLVEELAADIFMGSFTAKWIRAAHATARVLANSLYVRYYAIDTRELLKLRASAANPGGVALADDFAALCQRRAQPIGSGVAANGKIIEQSQILTTHNLAALFEALPLRDRLAPHLRTAADACFAFVLRRLTARTRSFHEVLIHLKSAAYAWRQMIFFLSFVDDVPDFLVAARRSLSGLDEGYRTRFAPAMHGLELAAEGLVSNEPAFTMSGARVFLGWTTEHPWLAPPKPTT